MDKSELIQKTLNKLIRDEKKYSFPDFLFLIRGCFGVSRIKAAKEMGVPGSRLFRLETGAFRNYLCMKDVVPIAEYYGIDSAMLLMKADDYVEGVEPCPHYPLREAS
jgi:hypothetical protein